MSEQLSTWNQLRWFHYMEEISRIPRESGHTEQIAQYLLHFAKERSLSAGKDEYGNVWIKKKGSKGREHEPAVMIQGHMDMVCEKEEGSAHDFSRDGLQLYIDGECLRAKGTTLGADDGIAIAYGLAILESNTISHPPIELVITADEEVGMLGADALDVQSLSSTRMINIDSEEDGVVLVSCAGGCRATIRFSLTRENREDLSQPVCVVTLNGLRGGHSGIEIQNGRENAAVLLGRVLRAVWEEVPFQIVNLVGGTKDNAITTSASAVVILPSAKSLTEFTERIEEQRKYLLAEYEKREPEMKLTLVKGETDGMPCSLKDTDRLLHFLLLAPQGVKKMSDEVEGLVESSLNLGILVMSEQSCEMSYSVRSSKAGYKKYMLNQLRMLAQDVEAEFSTHGNYPAWEFQRKSPLRDVYHTCFRKVTGKDALEEAIHAGLECGIIGEKMPGIDIISIGADTYDIHTPQEALNLPSAKNVYEILLLMLETM